MDKEDRLEITIQKYLEGQLALLHAPARTNKRQKVEEETSMEHPKRAILVQPIVQKVIMEKVIHEDNPAIDLFAMDTFEQRVEELKSAFKDIPNINHALAVKANPVRGVLKVAKEKGLGLECASYPEAKHSLNIGVEARKVVFDTPCKTYSELKEMMVTGCYINLDNLDEVQKVNDIFKELGPDAMKEEKHQRQIGLRINPVVGGGAISSTSTATASSKFGLPLTEETAQDMHELFEQNAWLQGVHVHVGSQGCAIELLVMGAQRAVQFVQKTNKRLGREQIKVIDIGGGMPTLYNGISEAYTYFDYAKLLKEQVPDLFSGKYNVITEFGRSAFVKSGITLTRVEAVKTWCNQRKAVVHVGANQFLRTAYLPDQWKHCLSVFDSQGNVKEGAYIEQDIAGPMCFSGDFIAKKVLLPPIAAGDYLVIHDTGGYTTAMYSKYNSRRASAMYAYDKNHRLSVLKDRETCEETLAFWGHANPKTIEN